MKWNWFSPLPPARTDIGHYTARILPSLRAHADLHLWTEQSEWDASVEQHAAVRCLDPPAAPWPALHEGDISFFNIGNNSDFHCGIWEISRRAPGIVVLHDLCLQHLFAGMFLDRRKDRATYTTHMARHYGPAGEAIAANFLAGACSTEDLAVRYPLTSLAIENALGVVVHTPAAFETVSRLTACPVLYTPLPYPASARPARTPKVHPPYDLVAAGYIGPNRKLPSVIEALAGMPERHQFRLHIYGAVWDPPHLQGLLRAHHLEGQAQIYGYVEDLDAALAAADLAVNLRYPTMGEASGSQLRLWDHALPTLVTRTGWYASLPEDCVMHIRPERDIEDIQAALRRFLADPGTAAALGCNGRRRLETEHAPEQYAAALTALVPHALRYSPCLSALRVAERVGTDLKQWIAAPAAAPLIDRAAAQIHTMLRPATARAAGA